MEDSTKYRIIRQAARLGLAEIMQNGPLRAALMRVYEVSRKELEELQAELRDG